MFNFSMTLQAPRPERVLAPHRTTRKSLAAGHLTAALALLAITSTPAHAGNAVVIDFDQAGLILGWIGLWAVAALSFVLCADKRLDPMARLSRLLAARARRHAQYRADREVMALAQDDPRILADIRAATIHSKSQDDDLPVTATALTGTSDPAQPTCRTTNPRFTTSPMPGMPAHMQYLPS